MRRLLIVCAAIVMMSASLRSIAAQNAADLVGRIDRAIKEKESAWQCSAMKSASGIPEVDTPRGASHQLVCTHDERVVMGYVFYGDSKQDAARVLKLSQLHLQVNESRSLEGFGEQAYVYVGGGGAWLAFRKSNVFADVHVGYTKLPKGAATPDDLEKFTAGALEIAKRFARLIEEQIPGMTRDDVPVVFHGSEQWWSWAGTKVKDLFRPYTIASIHVVSSSARSEKERREIVAMLRRLIQSDNEFSDGLSMRYAPGNAPGFLAIVLTAEGKVFVIREGSSPGIFSITSEGKTGHVISAWPK